MAASNSFGFFHGNVAMDNSELTVDGINALIATTHDYVKSQYALHKEEKHNAVVGVAMAKLDLTTANLQLISRELKAGTLVQGEALHKRLKGLKVEITDLYESVANLAEHIPSKFKVSPNSTN